MEIFYLHFQQLFLRLFCYDINIVLVYFYELSRLLYLYNIIRYCLNKQHLKYIYIYIYIGILIVVKIYYFQRESTDKNLEKYGQVTESIE